MINRLVLIMATIFHYTRTTITKTMSNTNIVNSVFPNATNVQMTNNQNALNAIHSSLINSITRNHVLNHVHRNIMLKPTLTFVKSVLLNALNVETTVVPVVCLVNRIKSTIMENVLINVQLGLSHRMTNVYQSVITRTVINVVQIVTNVQLVEE